mgnify:CR=1
MRQTRRRHLGWQPPVVAAVGGLEAHLNYTLTVHGAPQRSQTGQG